MTEYTYGQAVRVVRTDRRIQFGQIVSLDVCGRIEVAVFMDDGTIAYKVPTLDLVDAWQKGSMAINTLELEAETLA